VIDLVLQCHREQSPCPRSRFPSDRSSSAFTSTRSARSTSA
jgi:hypothetical protein